jgi:hypothetical protein
MMAVCGLMACEKSSSDDSGSTDTSVETTEDSLIEATFTALDPSTGAGVSGLSVMATDESGITDDDGQSTLSLETDTTFEVRIEGDGLLNHVLVGPAGDEPFNYISFVSTESLYDTVLSMMSVEQKPDTGIVVVGVDYDDLSPVVGAKVSIGNEHDQAFTLSSTGPQVGDTIPEGAMGMVSFPNVKLGESSVLVEPPDGVLCTAFPGGGQMPYFPVMQKFVTVVQFHCR